MIHLYCGDGKGKTTAAFGLALRAAGRGMPVTVAQFLKGEDSGERPALAHVPGVTLLPLPRQVKFVFAMDEDERAAESVRCRALLARAEALAAEGAGLVVLDECCAAVSAGLLPLAEVTAFLDRYGRTHELVLTGRDPDPALVERADYITEMKKVRHPYDAGVRARRGVEW